MLNYMIYFVLFYSFEFTVSSTIRLGVIRNASLITPNTISSMINGTCEKCGCAMLSNASSDLAFNCFPMNNTCELFSHTLLSQSFWIVGNSTNSFYFLPRLIDEMRSRTAFIDDNMSTPFGKYFSVFENSLNLSEKS